VILKTIPAPGEAGDPEVPAGGLPLLEGIRQGV
jgi:hypothetical protein